MANRFLQCASCGARVEVPEEVRSTTCAFCDSALVDGAAEQAEPVDRVVPFVIPRERASGLLREHLASRWFAPEALRKATRPDELRQVFVPFWCFDALARSEFQCGIGIYWYRTETYTTTENGKTVTRTRQVRETEWFDFAGSHVRQWFDHLVSASVGLPEHEANALEPFDLGRSVPYASAAVAGIVAERATVGHDQALATARQELADLEAAVIAREHLPGSTYRDLRSTTRAEMDEPRLVLMPIWIGSVRRPDGAVRMVVNGQTGEVVGKVPTSTYKVALAVALTLLLIGALVLALLGVSS
jgi:hypothetical protein